MSTELHSPWAEFLEEIDGLLSNPTKLYCLGGFVLTTLYSVPRTTGDVDYIAVIPQKTSAKLTELAGPGSKLSRKHKLEVHHVGVAEVPENYEDRLVELFPQRFSYLQLYALEIHDLVLAKLTRNHPVDNADVQFLAKANLLDPNLLQERYKQELRPNLVKQEWHDMTLQLWLEDYFQGLSSDRQL